MLNPNTRQTYLEELRPPEGFSLDLALATTFSLDLVALLLAPVSMALNDYRIGKDTLNDPVAMLEAIRKITKRCVIFCQQGRISVPATQSPLYAHLEPMVVEVTAMRKDGVFHPKAWLMRFSDDTGAQPIYRFICLTRNLTFDRSWDTALVLEGHLAENRTRGFSINRPLSDFVSSLKTLSVRNLEQSNREIVDTIADEIKRVRFELPEGLNGSYRFLPTGINGYRRLPAPSESKRTLVLSPFISPSTLYDSVNNGVDNMIISRAESLDEISDQDYDRLSKLAQFFTMDSAAEIAEDDQEETGVNFLFNGQRGLHAKLMVFEQGWDARLLTGSANATSAAFKGKNVELMVELLCKRASAGVNALLGNETDRHTLRSMLQPYKRHEQKADDENLLKKIEKKLDEARRRISEAGAVIVVSADKAGEFRMEIKLGKQKFELPKGFTGHYFPISLGIANRKKLKELARTGNGIFQKVTPESLTSFVAFELIGKQKSEKLGTSFVLNLPVSGMPTDRDRLILRSVLKDRDRFIRYLLLILGSGIDGPPLSEAEHAGKSKKWARSFESGLPLFEELVRAFSRDPEKIHRVKRLVRELKDAGNTENVFPEGFEDLWDAFNRAKLQRG